MDTRTSATEAAAAMSGVSETDQPSTTTITTVAVQAGKAKIVLAILKVSPLSLNISFSSRIYNFGFIGSSEGLYI